MMERKHRFFNVRLNEIDFQVSGDWEEYQAATETDPAEGGCFYEYRITIEGLAGDIDFTEMLDNGIIFYLVSNAEEGLRGMV